MIRNLISLLISQRKIIPITFFLAVAAFFLSAGCTNPDRQSNQSLIPDTINSKGFLTTDALPDIIALLPPPPTEGSIAYELDKEIIGNSINLRGSPRWDMAADHLNGLLPELINTFYCSLNAQITMDETPYLYALLYRTDDDVGFTSNIVQHKYNRPRPFLVNNEPRCVRQKNIKYLSYPAGGAAKFWAWALILSEIAPEKSDDILARGRAFGQSYVICNDRWQSDVSEGRVLGSIVVARLHAVPEFQIYLEAAKSELASVWAKELPPIRDCEIENAIVFQSSLTKF